MEITFDMDTSILVLPDSKIRKLQIFHHYCLSFVYSCCLYVKNQLHRDSIHGIVCAGIHTGPKFLRRPRIYNSKHFHYLYQHFPTDQGFSIKHPVLNNIRSSRRGHPNGSYFWCYTNSSQSILRYTDFLYLPQTK